MPKITFDNKDILDAFLKCIRKGMTNVKACDYAGVCEATLYTYINQGIEDEKNGVEDSKFYIFLKSYKKAKAEFQQKNLEIIEKSSENGSWQASAWLLERRCPEEFGMKQEITGIDRIEIVNDIPKEEA